MSLTLKITNPIYTVGIEGTLFFDLQSQTETHYTFTAKELPGGMSDFPFTIPKSEAETDGNIDPTKLFIWIMKKGKELLCPTCE